MLGMSSGDTLGAILGIALFAWMIANAFANALKAKYTSKEDDESDDDPENTENEDVLNEIKTMLVQQNAQHERLIELQVEQQILLVRQTHLLEEIRNGITKPVETETK